MIKFIQGYYLILVYKFYDKIIQVYKILGSLYKMYYTM